MIYLKDYLKLIFICNYFERDLFSGFYYFNPPDGLNYIKLDNQFKKLSLYDRTTLTL